MKRVPGTSADRSCTGKVQHESLKRALRAVASLVRKKEAVRGELQPYECRFCHKWHIGHPRRELLKIEPARRSA